MNRRLWFWVVNGTPTETGRPEYYVVYDSDSPRTWTCTCPHFIYRRMTCKHIALCKPEPVYTPEELLGSPKGEPKGSPSCS